MKNSPRPFGSALELLEERSLPAAFGIPWADPGHVTLSFTPDGTPTPRGPATTGQTLGDAAEQREVLRAFQTWAAATNINIGLVRDGGLALGTPGAVQGDARFGDIRVSAAPLSPGAVASALPFSWTGTTFGGDVLFNSAAAFGTGAGADGFDVYSVALHEAGHTFGLDHSTAAGSVMAENYAAHTGLGASDLAAVQALYGVRAPDAADAAGGNDTAARATAMKASGLAGRVVADGDVTTAADVDFYKFSTLPTLGLTSVTVRLQAAGLSLLTAKVTVYNAAGQVVATGAATDPLKNDVTLKFTNAPFGGTFYAKVEGATDDVFGIGAYRLTVDTLDLTVPVPVVSALLAPVADGGLNDTLASATDLTPAWTTAPDARFDSTFRGAIETRSDVDTYKVKAPAGTGPVGLNVLVWGTDAAPLNPRVRVYDAAGAPVAFQVLANDTGVFSVVVPAATPGATYYVAVSGRTPNGANATGGYFIGADFNHLAAAAPAPVAAGAVDAETAQSGTLTVTRAAVTQFALSADAPGGAAGVVTMTVLDADGRVVLTLEATAGQPLTTAVRYLPVGTYTVRYTTRAAGQVGFGLGLLELSDDVGPYASTTTTQSPGMTSTMPPPMSTQSAPPPSTSPQAPAPASTQTAPPPSTSPAPGTSSPDGTGYTYTSPSTMTTKAAPYYF